MLSLRDKIREEAQVPDLGDRKPNEQNKNLIDSSLIVTPDMPLFDRINLLLKSTANTQVVWALTNIPKLSSEQSIYYIPQLIDFLSSENLIVEFHAVYCATLLSKQKVTSSKLFLAAIERAKIYPAFEYAQLIESMIPLVPDSLLNDNLVDFLFGLLKMNLSYQHFAGYLFSALPFERIPSITTESFPQFYAATAVATIYLPEISKRASVSFGTQWFNQILPQQLLTMANIREAIRPAATKTVISHINYTDEKGIFMFVLTAFSWASNSDEISLILLEASNELLTKKKDKFLQKYTDIAGKIMGTSNIEIKKKLPKIFATQPLIFAGHEHLLKNILKKFQKETSIDVRKEFLKAIPIFYKNYTSNSIREVLKNCFAQFFNEPSGGLAQLLISSSMYSHLSQQMITFIIPQFLKLAHTFINKWRVFDQSMRTFVTLSDEYFLQFFDQFKPIVLQAMNRNTRPLTLTCQLLLSRKLHISKENDIISSSDWIVKNFAQSPSLAMRSFFITFSYSVCYSMPIEIFSEYIWPANVKLANDASVSVVATLAKALPKFRRFFQQMCDPILEKQALTIFSSLRKTKDPYLLSVTSEQEKNFYTITKKTDPDEGILVKSMLPSLTRSSGNFVKNPQSVEKVLARTALGQQSRAALKSPTSVQTTKTRAFPRRVSLMPTAVALKH